MSELQTVRDILSYGIFLREESVDDRKNYQVDKLMGDIYPALICQFGKANVLFKKIIITPKIKEF